MRHLIFHCFPKIWPTGEPWRRSVAHLLARWDQFDGRRIVSVAYDESTRTPDEVREMFGEHEVEIQSVRNSPLQEVESFPRLLEAVSKEPGTTLYAHSKGCTHHNPESASHWWCDAMAEACLDYPELVDCALSRADICGAFRSRQPVGWPVSPAWHFAGTWYWFKNDALFRRDWRKVDPILWGVEAYPGWKFPLDRSACLFLDHAETLHLYDPGFWNRAIHPALRAWRQSLASCGVTPIMRPGFSPPTSGFALQSVSH